MGACFLFFFVFSYWAHNFKEKFLGILAIGKICTSGTLVLEKHENNLFYI